MNQRKQPLGFWTLSALVAGNMIGSGVYLLPSSLAKFGSISLFSWCFTALGAILLALVFATLSRVMPKIGGPYAYCRAAYGDFIGFQVAYNYWIAMWVGNAAIAVAFTGYLFFFFPLLQNQSLFIFLVSSLIVWLLTFINIIGIHWAGKVQILTTVFKLFPLILLSIVGVAFIKWENLSQFNVSPVSDYQAFMSASALTLWAFIGLESASIPTENVENPKVVIPKATLFGTFIAAITYILSTYVIMGTISNAELAMSESPYALSAYRVFGNVGSYLIAFGALFACLGTLNGWILLQGQMPYAAAKDKLFPGIFAKTSKFGTPIFGLIISAILITILLSLNLHKMLVEQFTFIISLAVVCTLIPYLFTTFGEMILFVKYPKEFSTVSFYKNLLIALGAFAYSLWMVNATDLLVVKYGLLFSLTGLPLYWSTRIKRNYLNKG